MAGNTFNVMAVITGRVTGLDQFDAFNKRLNTSGKTADSVNRQMASLRNAIAGLGAALGGVQLADFAAELARVAIQLDAFRAQLTQGYGDYASQQLENTRRAMRDFGIAQEEALGSGVRFQTSMRLSGVSTRDATAAFRDAAKWIAVNRLNGEEANRVFNAMSQIFSKNRVTAEELRGQIGDSGIAGAFELVAQALGKTGLELSKAMEQGQVSAEDFRLALGRIASGIDDSQLDSAARSLADLKNAWFDLKAALLSADTVKTVLDAVASGLQFLADNAEEIKATAVNAVKVAAAFALWRGASTFVWALAFSLRTYGLAATIAINITKPLRAAIMALNATLMVNPFIAIATAITGLIALLYTFKDAIRPVSGEAATLGDYLSVVGEDIMSLTSVIWEFIGGALSSAKEALGDLAEALFDIDWETAGQYAKGFGNLVIGVMVSLPNAAFQAARLIVAAFTRAFTVVTSLGSAFSKDLAAVLEGDLSFSNSRGAMGQVAEQAQALMGDARNAFNSVRGSLTRDYLGEVGSYLQSVRSRANQRARRPADQPMPVNDGRPSTNPGEDGDGDSDRSRSRAERRNAFEELMDQLRFEREQLQRNARDQFIQSQLRQAEVSAMSAQGIALTTLAGQLFDEREALEETNRQLERQATLRELVTKAMQDSASVRDEIDRLSGRSRVEIERRNYQEGITADIDQTMAGYARQKDAAGRPLYTREQLVQFRAELEAAGAEAMRIFDQSQSDLAAAQGNWVNGLKSGMQAYTEGLNNFAGTVETTIVDAFKGAEDALTNFVMTGKLNFRDFANAIIADIIRIGIQQAIMKPLMMAFGFADGGAFGQGGIIKLAAGGVVNGATPFLHKGGLGVMGEAGPEAVMPLKRLSNGRLGVEAVGMGASSGGGVQNVSVTVNVEGGGSKVQGDAGKAGQLGQVIAQAVRNELVVQKRPGGLLAA